MAITFPAAMMIEKMYHLYRSDFGRFRIHRTLSHSFHFTRLSHSARYSVCTGDCQRHAAAAAATWEAKWWTMTLNCWCSPLPHRRFLIKKCCNEFSTRSLDIFINLFWYILQSSTMARHWRCCWVDHARVRSLLMPSFFVPRERRENWLCCNNSRE